MNGTEYTFWLIPALRLRNQLLLLIRELAKKYDVEPVDPHVTVYSGSSDDAEALAIAQHIVGIFAPLKLDFEKLGHTKLLHKTLFMQFRQSPELQRMTEFIRSNCAHPSSYELNPHVSLLYKQMLESEQEKLCRTLPVPQGDCTFDGLQVIEMGTPFRADRSSIRRWRTVFIGKLGEPH